MRYGTTLPLAPPWPGLTAVVVPLKPEVLPANCFAALRMLGVLPEVARGVDAVEPTGLEGDEVGACAHAP